MRTDIGRKLYTEGSVIGKEPMELIIMLHDGAIRFLRKAKHDMQAGRLEEKHEQLLKAKRIVVHFLSALEGHDGEAVDALQRFYGYCFEHISLANMNNDPAEVDRALNVLTQLHSGLVTPGANTPSA